MKRNAIQKREIAFTRLGVADSITISTVTNPSVEPVTVSQRVSSECQMRGLLRYGLLLRQRHEGGRRLLGSFVHDGVDAIHEASRDYPDGYNTAAILALADRSQLAIDAKRNAMAAETKKNGALFDPNRSNTTVAEIMELADLARDICNRYIWQWFGSDPFEVDLTAHNLSCVASEITLTIRIHDAHGKPTKYTHTGKLDRVFADARGQFAISDTKTSSMPLPTWKASHEYMPQLWSYAVMFWRATGEVPAYFLDDMISTKDRPLAAHELPRNKDGTLSKTGLPRTLASVWQEVIDEEKAAGREMKDWYFDALRDLKHAESEGRWFLRVVRPISMSELVRAEAEMLADAKKAEKQRKRIAKVKAELGIDRVQTPEQVSEVVAYVPIAERMRSTSLCHAFNRPCDYLDFCRKPCTSTADLYRISDTAHAELADPAATEDSD